MHGYDPEGSPFEKFLAKAMPAKRKPEPVGVERERERQEALRARSERLEQWRRYAAQEHETLPDGLATGDTHRAVRERAQLSIGDAAEILGVSPNDVQAYERGQRTYADESFRHFTAAMRDALR